MTEETTNNFYIRKIIQVIESGSTVKNNLLTKSIKSRLAL
jgi:hypothetical protein